MYSKQKQTTPLAKPTYLPERNPFGHSKKMVVKTETPSVKTPSIKDLTGKAFWGPPEWTALHTKAVAFRPEKAAAIVRYVEALPDLLPCDECAEHLRGNLLIYPIRHYLKNNHDLFFWTYLLHDLVNQQISKTTGVPRISPPYNEIKAHYFRALSDDCSACRTI